MANAVEKVNTIAIASIEAINTITDANLQALNTLEFTGVAPDAHVLIKANASDGSDATLSFIDGTAGVVFDSTYDVYEFHFVNMHPENNGAEWQFQVNAAGESGFNETITSTIWRASHSEDDSAHGIEYQANYDQAQGTAYNQLTDYTSGSNEGSLSGIFTLYAPSSTTYVKHFQATIQDLYDATSCTLWQDAGYINTTAAIDEISFEFDNGEIQGGEIRMYGIKKS